jgi:hypothetical protein
MSNNIIIHNTFNLNTIDISDIIVDSNYNDTIQNIYWCPNDKIINKIEKYCKINNLTNVLEIGPGIQQFQLANYFIGKNEKIEKYIDLDIDIEKIPYDNRHFDFIFCRHVLEDIQNPDFVIKEMYRSSKSGYFETPSAIAEIIKGIDHGNDVNYRGYIHHRYISWYDYKTNNLYFLPKYPIIEYLTFDNNFYKKLIKLMNEYCVYWNNCVLWNENNKPNIIMLKNGVNFEIRNDYSNLIYKALLETIESTNYFIHNTINI